MNPREMTSTDFDEQRRQLVARLSVIRDSYEKCLADVSSEVANSVSEWSVVNLVRHVTGSYRSSLTRLLEEDHPDLGAGFDPDASWRRLRNAIFRDIDEAIRTANDLTVEQLQRSGQRAGGTVRVLDILKLMVDHYDDHLMQLRDEILPREGLPMR